MFVGVLCHANNDQVIKNTIMGTQRGEWWRFGSTQGIELVQAGALRPVWGWRDLSTCSSRPWMWKSKGGVLQCESLGRYAWGARLLIGGPLDPGPGPRGSGRGPEHLTRYFWEYRAMP